MPYIHVTLHSMATPYLGQHGVRAHGYLSPHSVMSAAGVGGDVVGLCSGVGDVTSSQTAFATKICVAPATLCW